MSTKENKKQNSIKVSLCVALYNCEKYIKRCIDSLLLQDYENIEIVIVNDGSTDSSLSILSSYCDDRIRIITTINQGLSCARNEGIFNSVGDYICFIDADDYVLPTFVSSFVNALKKYKTDYCFGGLCLFNEGKIVQINRYENNGIKFIDDKAIIDKPFKSICSAIFKRDFLVENHFDEKCPMYYEDFLFGVTLIKLKHGLFCQCTDANYVYCDNDDLSVTRISSYSTKDSKRALCAVYCNVRLISLFDDREIKEILLERAFHLLMAYHINIHNHKDYFDKTIFKECKFLLLSNAKCLSFKSKMIMRLYLIAPWLLNLLPKTRNRFQ